MILPLLSHNSLTFVRFYAQFAGLILTQYLMVFKIKLREERPMDTGNVVNKHLRTGPKGNSEFCFPETLSV